MDTRTPKEDRKALVVRHNTLIESRHKLTLLERRFLLWIISQISKSDSDMHTYEISVARFVQFSGLKKHDAYYQQLSEMANSLTQKNIVIKNPELKKDEYYSWFKFIGYSWGEGQITARLNDEIRPLLLELKEQYTVITLEYALLLKSSYAHRLYDLLKQYERIGERTMGIERMKEIFDIVGKYPDYKNFRIRIIEAAQKEINQKTDISFDFFPIKEGRKTTSIRFVIHHKAPKVTLDNPEETDPHAKTLFHRLVKHGVEEDTARNLVGDYDSTRVKWHINEYEVRRKSDKPPAGAGWIIDGIKKDYRPQRNIFEESEAKERAKKAKVKQKREQLEKEADRIKKECDKHDREARIAIAKKMPEEEQADMFEHLVEKFGNVMGFAGKIKNEGLENPMVLGICLDFIRERHPETQSDYYEYGKSKGVKANILEILKTPENQ